MNDENSKSCVINVEELNNDVSNSSPTRNNNLKTSDSTVVNISENLVSNIKLIDRYVILNEEDQTVQTIQELKIENKEIQEQLEQTKSKTSNKESSNQEELKSTLNQEYYEPFTNEGNEPPPNQGYFYGPPPNQGYYYGPPPSNQGYYGPPSNPGYYGPPPNQSFYGPPPNQMYYGPPPIQRYQQSNENIRHNNIPIKFETEQERRTFVSKVLMLVFLGLMVTAIFVSPFAFTDAGKQMIQSSFGLICIIFAMLLYISVAYVMCCVDITEIKCCSSICYTLIIICQVFFVAFLCTHAPAHLIFMAVIITASLTFLLFLIAKCSPIDFTKCGGLICVMILIASIVMLVASIIYIFLQIKIILIVAVSVVIIVLMALMIYDIQLILGGRGNSINSKNYVFAALMLYLDIILLFQYILRLLMLVSDN